MDREKLTEKRIEELIRRCEMRGIPVHTDLMSPTGQDAFARLTERESGVRAFLFGGYEGAERKAGFLLPAEESGKLASAVDLTANPGARSEAVRELTAGVLAVLRADLPKVGAGETLSHRDWLGAVMNLGIDRGKVGDILPDEGGAYLICMEEMADHIAENLTRVRHSNVSVRRGTLPESITNPVPETREFSVASLRIDSVAAGAFGLSRSKAAALIAGEQVFVNGKMISSASAELKEDDVITVRHFGRAVFRGCSGRSKKGRLFVEADVFR